MILFENSFFKLDYDPATDILEVAYPDLHGYLLPEIKHSITILVETVKNYDIKKMLLDSSKVALSVSEEDSREVSTYLASGLATTRIQKLARLQSPSKIVETTAQENMKHIQASISLPFQLQNFTNKREAVQWLSAD